MYPPDIQPLVDRLRFTFWHKGRHIGLTTDVDLVDELAARGVRSFPYKRARDSERDEYEVVLPVVTE